MPIAFIVGFDNIALSWCYFRGPFVDSFCGDCPCCCNWLYYGHGWSKTAT